MAITTIAGLLDTLRKKGLLEAAQIEEIGRAPVGRGGDPKALAYEIVKRGWLTQYQIKQVWNGRVDALILGQYVLLEPLGEGGMGQVFKAKHRSLGRIVALKVIRHDRLANPAAIQRFQREIRAVSQMSHPNVVLAYDADQVGDRQIFVMEYAEGSDLGRLIKERGALSVGQACEYVRQTALGLQHAFERGLVHRDIKPSNLLVSGGVVKILDMGLSRLREGPEGGTLDATLTQDGSVVGTPDYMPPEQARDSHGVDVRADVYSLGCTLYHALTGSVPFPGGSPMEKVFKHQLEEPTPIEKLRTDLPKGLAAVVRKMMAKTLEQRYQTPAEVAQALEPFARLDAAVNPSALKVKKRQTRPPVIDTPHRGATTTRQDGTAEPTRPPPVKQRRRWLIAGLGAGLLASLSCVALLAIGWWASPGGGTALTGPGPTAKGGQPTLPAEALTVIGDPEWRHWGVVNGLAITADGRRLASGGNDNAVRIWGRDTGKETAIGWGHQGQVISVVFSPDGQMLASSGADGSVRLWNPATGAELTALTGHSGDVIALAFAPDGKLLASGGADNKVILWDVANRRQRSLLAHAGVVRSVSFAADGKMLAVAAMTAQRRNWEVKFWDVEQGRELFAVPFPEMLEMVLAFAPAGKVLAIGNQTTAKQGGHLGLYDAEKRETVHVIKENGPVRAVAFSGDGKTLIAAVNEAVKIYSAGPKLQPRTALRALSTRAVLCLAVAGKTIVAGQSDSVIAISEEGGNFKTVDGRYHRSPVNGLAVSPDGKSLLSVAAGDMQGVKVWNLPGGESRTTLAGHQGWINGVTFTLNGRAVAAWGTAGLTAWNATTGQKLPPIEDPTWNTMGAVLSPDGKTAAVLNQLETVKLHDLVTGKELAVLSGHTGPVTVAVFSLDNQTLLTGSTDRSIRTWDVPARKLRGVMEGQPGIVTALTFSGDGKIVAGAFAANAQSGPADVKLWEFASGKELAALGNLPTLIMGLACAPSGKPVVLWGQNFLKVWDGAQDTWSPLDGVSGSARSASLSHDGKLLAVATENRLLIRDLGSRKPVLDTPVPGPIGGLAFSPDDRTLYTANGNGTIYVVKVAK